MARRAKWTIIGALVAFTLALANTPATAQDLKVENVEVRLSTAGPAVLLVIGKRAIPVIVDPVVAGSIHGALTGQKSARPLTHDLMHNVLSAFDGRVSQVVVTLHEDIYYGALTIVIGGTTKVFDSRASDAIALAIHAKAPILVSRELLGKIGIEFEQSK